MAAPLRVAVTLEQCWHRVPGGVARAALGSAAALLADPTIAQVGVSARHARPPAPAFRPPIVVRPLPLPRLVLYECWHRMGWPPVSLATGPVQVIHATGMAIPPASVPLVVTVHDLAWQRWPHFFTPRGVSFFARSLELTRRHAALVVCPSEATAVDAVSAGLDPARVRIVPWGVDVGEPDDARVQMVRRAHSLERPYVLFVGTVEPRKNLPVVAEAFARLDRRDLDLVLVGPTGWRQDLPVLPAGGPGGLRVLGFVPDDDLNALYAGARVVCQPSLAEGFGFPVLEALAQGTPVVTSAHTATAEVLGPAGIAVDPRQASAVTEAMAAVLDDRDSYAAAARAQARRYPWSATASGLASVYREAAG